MIVKDMSLSHRNTRVSRITCRRHLQPSKSHGGGPYAAFLDVLTVTNGKPPLKGSATIALL